MTERYTNFQFFKDVIANTDVPDRRKKKSKPERILPEVNHEIRHTPSHKPGVRDGKK